MSIDKDLCGLGSSVNLMPYPIFKRLDLGDLGPTTISPQLANRYVKYPSGILIDVSIEVGDFYVLVDFVILDVDEDVHS